MVKGSRLKRADKNGVGIESFRIGTELNILCGIGIENGIDPMFARDKKNCVIYRAVEYQFQYQFSSSANNEKIRQANCFWGGKSINRCAYLKLRILCR